MFHTVVLSEEEMQVLKKIVAKFDSTIVLPPIIKPKKKSKSELRLEAFNEYLSKKKRKT